MGNTEFWGEITVSPPLNADEIGYLKKFSGTRRMARDKGPYFVHGSGEFGQGNDPDIRDLNEPPAGQPNLWCEWVPNENGTAIVWNGVEKFYDPEEWMSYLINHFLKSGAYASKHLAFLQANHTLNGIIEAECQESKSYWRIIVEDNQVRTG